MKVILSLYFVATTVAVAKSSAEAYDVSLLKRILFKSKHLLRGSGLNDEKETGPKRILEAGAKRLLQLKSINDDCCCDEYQPSSPSPTVTRSNSPSMSTEPTPSPSFLPSVTRSNPPSMYPSHSPSIAIYEEKKLVASDGSYYDSFGSSCSISDDLLVIGAEGVGNNEGAAYMFHLDGTEVKKLTPGNDGEDGNYFGSSVAMDEKVVVGTSYFNGDYVQVFSRQGIYERSISCDDCTSFFGTAVATLGNLIVMDGYQNSIFKLFVFSTEGELLKTLEQGSVWINDVAMSEQFIVSTGRTGKTFIYSNISPDFPKVAEINQGGYAVAVAGDRIVIGDNSANDFDGAADLYKTDGTLIKTLDRQDASSGSIFGNSVAITDDKVFVGAKYDDDQGESSGSIFIYSAVTGEFLEKVVAPDGEANDWFGWSVCASDYYFVVGARGVDTYTGAAYLFQSSE